jgi:hypothetical protein
MGTINNLKIINMVKLCYKKMVKQMRGEDQSIRKVAIQQAYDSNNCLEKCVILRKYATPQSNEVEKLIKHDLEIDKPLDNYSGDGVKNGETFEVKTTIHNNSGLVCIRQIRPHHQINHYIILTYNLHESNDGVARLFKIPAKKMYELVVQYGGYTHGTIKKNGDITKKSVTNKNNTHEYSLTPNPGSPPNTKSNKLWREFLKYVVTYDKNNF